jgi:hypothetical protein
MAKQLKTDVGYARGHMESHCGPTFHDDKFFCKHFLPGAKYAGKCELVEGDIEPVMWCELYKRTRK